jgi:hypothetical protein
MTTGGTLDRRSAQTGELFGVAGRGGGVGTLPWESPFELDLERHAQERSDNNNDRQHPDALEGGGDRHGADDVGGDQHFEAEKNRPPDSLAISPIHLLPLRPASLEAPNEEDGRECDASDDSPDARPVERFPDAFDVLLEVRVRDHRVSESYPVGSAATRHPGGNPLSDRAETVEVAVREKKWC